MNQYTVPVFAGSPGEWCGFTKYEYEFCDHGAIVCLPQKPLGNAPFIWRTEFFDAFAQADKAMLARGYALVHLRIPDMFGCPEAIEIMHKFYLHLISDWRFPDQCIPFGFSRGGLYAVNFAVSYPEAVAALYLDAPVLDLKSWPVGLGGSIGSAEDTGMMYRCYGLNEKTLPSFTGNPIDRVSELIRHSIPVVLVAGGADTLVPYAENGARLADGYENAGRGNLLYVTVKPDCEHHPHSLSDPTPICDQLEALVYETKRIPKRE